MFLPNRHPFRRDMVNFMARVQEEDHAPHTRTSVELLAELNMYGIKKVYEDGERKQRLLWSVNWRLEKEKCVLGHTITGN